MAMNQDITDVLFSGSRDDLATGRPAPLSACSTAMFDAILKTSPDCILATDQEGRLLFLSVAAARVLGTSPEDARGRSLADLEHIPQEIAALFDRCRQTVLRT